MATSILVNAESDVGRLARRILRDLGHRKRTVLKTVGVTSTDKAMEAVADVTGRTTAAALRQNVSPERVRFHVQLRPRRIRHPKDGSLRDGYRIDMRLANGDDAVERALLRGTFHTGSGFSDVTDEAGLHLDADAIMADEGEEVLRQVVMSAWECIRDANADVIDLRMAGILDENTPLLAYEMFLGPVTIEEHRGVRVLVRKATFAVVENEDGEAHEQMETAEPVTDGISVA